MADINNWLKHDFTILTKTTFYKKMTKELKPHEYRVIDEKDDLDSKLYKLESFFSTKTFSYINQDDQRLLKMQAQIMREYSNILQERIDNF
jgi:hypothetical protein